MEIYQIRQRDSYHDEPICYFKRFENAVEYIYLLVNMKQGAYKEVSYRKKWIYSPDDWFDGKTRRPMTYEDFKETLKEGYHWFLKNDSGTSLYINFLKTED